MAPKHAHPQTPSSPGPQPSDNLSSDSCNASAGAATFVCQLLSSSSSVSAALSTAGGSAARTLRTTSVTLSRQRQLAVNIELCQPKKNTGKTNVVTSPSRTKPTLSSLAMGSPRKRRPPTPSTKIHCTPTSAMSAEKPPRTRRQSARLRASAAPIFCSPAPSDSSAPPGRRATRAEPSGSRHMPTAKLPSTALSRSSSFGSEP